MRILSAAEAVTPAVARAKLVLFEPFRKGRTWKFAVTGYLSVASTAFLPFPLLYLGVLYGLRGTLSPRMMTVFVVVALMFTAIFLVVFYLCSRLRFAFFDVVLRREQFIAPAWKKYGPQSLKWVGFKIVVGSLLSVIVAVPAMGMVRNLIAVFGSGDFTPGQPPSPQFVAAIMSVYAGFALLYFVVGLFYFVSSIAGDFVVPSLALENTTLMEAFRRLWSLIKNETGQFFLYVVLKMGLGVAGYFGVTLAFYIVLLVAMLVVGVVAFAVGFVLHLMHVPMVVLIGLGITVAVVFYFALIFYVMAIGVGTLVTFLEAYTLYFLGGRYPLLGQLLEASTPVVSAPPVPPSFGGPPQWDASLYAPPGS